MYSKSQAGSRQSAEALCHWRVPFPSMKQLKTATVRDVLAGDTGDKANSIITLCTSHLLLKSQKAL